MTVRTSPPGAQVFVDEQEIGTAPASTRFVYYGTRKITAIKDGYETVTVFNRQPPPWYEIPPLDIISDNFWPFEARDERVIDIQLVPTQIVPEDQLLARAEALRTNSSAGQATALPGSQPGFQQPPPALPPGAPVPGVPGQGLYGTPGVGAEPLPPARYPPLPASPQQPGVIYPPAR